ncbi:nuclear transport factor 2 family protein [Xanthomonas vesicatoria]|uniref:nuclear transport factor 2 family protein n=1 Tax=Xanthomonas vesicatoria TaxID=56460 RepID=UPI001E310662|nr:nuclear transport factor 2 family protein [Xanthomonas vesicatoria]MCC8627364.1 nuclear transport factor 2 family protein [Xanthomonas vesicatoria]
MSLLVAFDTVAVYLPATPASSDERNVKGDTSSLSAYNACDMKRVGELVSSDIEFYHDKTGLSASRAAVVDSLRNGPCADPTSRLRRELIAESLAFHPLKHGYAILSGPHRFYVHKRDQPERLDGQADFITVWKRDGGYWHMHRVLSGAHTP